MHDHAPLRARPARRPLRLRLGLHRRRAGSHRGRRGDLTPVPHEVEPLPFIDEHAILAGASPEAVWEALGLTLRMAFDGRSARRLSSLLGTRDREWSEPFRLTPGASAPGFRVRDAVPEQRLSLEGSHRFAEYALTFHLLAEEGGTVVCAETRARFPGLRGRIYRAIVVGSRGHVVVTQRILRNIRRRSEAIEQATLQELSVREDR